MLQIIQNIEKPSKHNTTNTTNTTNTKQQKQQIQLIPPIQNYISIMPRGSVSFGQSHTRCTSMTVVKLCQHTSINEMVWILRA